MERSPTSSNLNVPNVLTVIRIIISVAIPAILLTQDTFWGRVLALVLFIIGSITDYADGYLARRENTVTTFGKIVDPIADKMLTLGTFITLSLLGMFPWWILIPVLIREIGITILRFYFLHKGVAVAAVKSGKMKTVFQMTSIVITFVNLIYQQDVQQSLSPELGNFIFTVLNILMWATLLIMLVLTLYSGYIFMQNNWHLFSDKRDSSI